MPKLLTKRPRAACFAPIQPVLVRHSDDHSPRHAHRSRAQKPRSTALGRRAARRRTRRRSSAAGILFPPPRCQNAAQASPALPLRLACGLGLGHRVRPLLRDRDQPLCGFDVGSQVRRVGLRFDLGNLGCLRRGLGLVSLPAGSIEIGTGFGSYSLRRGDVLVHGLHLLS